MRQVNGNASQIPPVGWGWREASSTATECGDLRIAQQNELYAYSVMAFYLLRVKLDILRLENGRMVQRKPDFLQDFCRNQWLSELVTLSACETGLGKLIRGEGLLSLTRGFMYAGATLRAAQVEMWRDKRWEAPYYWAAFTIQGEWR